MAVPEAKKILILDGPTGTELLARGFKPDPVLWTARAALDAPELLRAVHRDYLAAGANIITANTFRTTAHAFAKAGLSTAEARKFAHASIAAATEAIEELPDDAPGGPRFLAGSLAPLEDCYTPSAVPELAVLERAHFETAEWLVEAGCGVVLAETMGTAKETLVAVRAARKAGAAVAVSFLPDESGTRLLGGDNLLQTADLCARAGVESVLVNCAHADVAERALEALQPLVEYGVVLGAYANSARMHVHFGGGVTWEPDTRPEAERVAEYAERAATWTTRFGARIVGGCCGTSPAYISALAARLSRRE